MLIDPALFEVVEQLGLLRKLTRRPAILNELAFYSTAIEAPPEMFLAPTAPVPKSDLAMAADLVESVYTERSDAVAVPRLASQDDTIFAFWSQQWPKLRRNFRFQTALASGDSYSPNRFDLRLVLGDPLFAQVATPSRKIPKWVASAVEDIGGACGRELRDFLWLYGHDVKRQRGSFRPLCEVFDLSRSPARQHSELAIGPSIARSFPTRDDALTLKRDISDGRLLPDLQLDVYEYTVSQGNDGSFPYPSADGMLKLADFWPQDQRKMLTLAEQSVLVENTGASEFVSLVLSLIPPEAFWRVTDEHPRLRRRMIEARPETLAVSDVSAMRTEDLLTLIALVPFEHPVGEELTRHLLDANDVNLVAALLARFPRTAVRSFIAATNDRGSGGLEVWFQALAGAPSLVLTQELMSGVRRRSTLYGLAREFGWLSPEVLTAGATPWLAGLSDAKDDLSADDNDTLGCFLIALAIEAGGTAGQVLLEEHFDQLHGRIVKSELSWRASHVLAPHLPALIWWRAWDFGLRLRLGVAQAYVVHNLDPDSFARLTKNKAVRELLRQAAAETPGGQRYAIAETPAPARRK